MASGTFTIPMSQYYAKSKILKSNVDQVSQDVTNNFINRVNDNLSQLDGNDQTYLENVESYITAKNLNNKLQTEHLMNLGYMSTENPNNPLYQLVERDKHYSSTFQDIADNSCVGKVVTSPWFSVAVESGFSAVNGFFNKGSETYMNVGKSVVGGVIDGIASIGPIKGALLGAKIVGPLGAVVGFFFGSTVQLVQLAFPNLKDNIKDGAYKLVDNMTEIGKSVGQKISSVVDNAGKAIENGVNQIKNKASQLLDNLIPDIPKIDFGWFS